MMRHLTISLLVILAATVVEAQLVIPPVTAECATSVDGSVVLVPNPLGPPVVAPVFSGTLPAGTYFVEEAWYDAAAHTTLVSPEVQIQLSATGEITENPPITGLAGTAVGRNIYIGTTSGSETLQGTVVGSGTYTQSVPLVTGANPPAVNNTVCMDIANDAAWPTGTGYNVSLTTPAGQTLPGWPMEWQLLGPGNTINVAMGLPLYNGVVTYPVPILARPFGHGPQSISGNLSMTGFNITNVGKLGFGTTVPAWAIDVEGSGVLGAINANTGYLFNGAAPLNHILLGNGNYYVDSPLSGLNINYQTVAVSGTLVVQEPILNFIPGAGTAISCVDNSGATRTDCTISATITGQSNITLTTNSGAGTGPSISCQTTVCIDAGGWVSVTTGSTPPAGLVAVASGTFGGTYAHAYCTLFPANTNAAALIATTLMQGGASNWQIENAGSALAATTNYQWQYTCTFK